VSEARANLEIRLHKAEAIVAAYRALKKAEDKANIFSKFDDCYAPAKAARDEYTTAVEKLIELGEEV